MSKLGTVLAKEKIDNNIYLVVNALQEVCDNEYVKKVDLFEHDFQRIIDRLLDDSFRVAVVGEFSSGKSTFLNALLGKDLLKHGSKETTATITEIHNRNNEENEMYLDVYYMSGKVEQHVSIERIMDYTATASRTHAVAQEIEKVVINGRIIDSDARICLVDTPGLNGVADNHREKTIEEIKKAHACIYLMQVRGLGQSDIDFLKYISNYQHNIVFVQNFIDELKELEGETVEQKIEQQKKIIEEKLKKENQDIRYKIVAVSSSKALISKSNDFDDYHGEKLTEELRDTLYEESRFDNVFTVINNLKEYNEKEKQRDTVKVALVLLKQLKGLVSFENEKGIASWEASVDGRNSTNYRKLIDGLNENKQSYINKLKNYLEVEISVIRKESKREIDDGLIIIEDRVKSIITDIAVITEFDNFVKTNLSGLLYQSVTSLDKNIVEHVNTRFENMVANAVLRIKQYTGSENNAVNPEIFKAAIIETGVKSFVMEEDEITILQRELSEKKALDKKADMDIKKMRMEISQIDLDIESQRRIIEQENRNMRAEMYQLGVMPEKETKYREETYYEKRKGLGFIFDILFGEKERKRMVPYSDDTNQQRWLKSRSDIEIKYRDKENALSAQRRMLESRKRQKDDEIKHLEKTEAARKNDIMKTQSLLETKINYLNIQKEKVKQEYLREAKRSILEDIHDYLYETIFETLYDNNQTVLVDNSRRANQVVMSLFEVSFETRIKLLHQKLDQINGIKSSGNNTELLSLITKCIQRMEAF